VNGTDFDGDLFALHFRFVCDNILGYLIFRQTFSIRETCWVTDSLHFLVYYFWLCMHKSMLEISSGYMGVPKGGV